ncbi:MAG: glucose-1-phosphate adenylyltransferase subunit GlgD [Solobacterium sp.]|nr:glucose-1-phosphate adenylyltransferase subunit GlgD [Solobacterium sp.]
MNALGIISFEDNTVSIDGLDEFRPVAAIGMFGRYRVIDFVLSNMTNSGIDHVQVYCKEKPRNLFEHLRDGSDYNINSKRGNLRILYGEKDFSAPVYNTDVANFMLNMQYIEGENVPYVLVAPSYFIYSYDFNELLKEHEKARADVSILYMNTSQGRTRCLGCDSLELNKGRRVTVLRKNMGRYQRAKISMEAYLMRKDLFISLVKEAAETSSLYWFKDILADKVDDLFIQGVPVSGYVACLNSLPEYYRTNMELLDPVNVRKLFNKDRPIYTQTRDSSPTNYLGEGTAVNSVLANGSVIEGTVINSQIGRNVKIGKGAVVRNSIILTSAEIGQNVMIDHAVVDKYAVVKTVKELHGTEEAPVYVKRRDRI